MVSVMPDLVVSTSATIANAGIILTCPICGIEFTVQPCKVKVGKKNYCSRKCSDQGKSNKVLRPCDHCGAEYLASPRLLAKGYDKFCSHDCYNQARITSITRKCLVCGKEIKVIKSAVEKGYGKYCSQKCRAKDIDRKIEHTCAYCGKSIRLIPYRSALTDEHYCSKECLGLHRTGEKSPSWKRVEVECHICGKTIEIPPYRTKAAKNHYCSKECQRAGVSGERAPLWRGGISFEPYCPKFNEELKESVRLEFDRRCYLCNQTEGDNGKHLSIHHVDYQKSQGCNGQRWSLVPLCAKCHSKTNGNRQYWFCLLRDYWLNFYLDFTTLDLTKW